MLRYLEEEYKECKDIHDKARVEFQSRIRQMHYDLNVFDEELEADRESAGYQKKDKHFDEKKE